MDNDSSDSEDEQFDQDEDFLDEPRQDRKYYIGACKLIRPDNYFLILSVISNRLFMQYSAPVVRRYLESASLIYVHDPPIDIMQLEFRPHGTMTTIKKTYWIRLIQRHWRSVLNQRMEIIIKRGSVVAQRHFEINGRYPYQMNVLPGLYGMMRTYNNS